MHFVPSQHTNIKRLHFVPAQGAYIKHLSSMLALSAGTKCMHAAQTLSACSQLFMLPRCAYFNHSLQALLHTPLTYTLGLVSLIWCQHILKHEWDWHSSHSLHSYLSHPLLMALTRYIIHPFIYTTNF